MHLKMIQTGFNNEVGDEKLDGTLAVLLLFRRAAVSGPSVGATVVPDQRADQWQRLKL